MNRTRLFKGIKGNFRGITIAARPDSKMATSETMPLVGCINEDEEAFYQAYGIEYGMTAKVARRLFTDDEFFRENFDGVPIVKRNEFKECIDD